MLHPGTFPFKMVRMIQAGQMPVGAFDLRLTTARRNAKQATGSLNRQRIAVVEIAVPIRTGILIFWRILRPFVANL